MEKIIQKYHEECKKISDINEHLPIILKYSNNCNHITEMGVRWASSTIALLMSNAKKIISYDIIKWKEIDNIISLSNEYKINYHFIQSDVLDIEIEPTELLFTDTLHTYNQLFTELILHSKNVSKFIIIHDTVTFAYNDEGFYEHVSDVVKNKKIIKNGLINAINDFLKTEIGTEWFIFEEYKNNNGLMILKRKK